MQITEETAGEVLVLKPSGHLDTRTQHEFEERVLAKLNAGQRRFLIDMSGVEYISSAGLRVMLMLAKKLTSTDGQLVLSGMNDHVHQVFEISGFTGVFTIRKTTDEGLRSFSNVDGSVARVANLASRLMDVSKDAQPSSSMTDDDAKAVAAAAVRLLRLNKMTDPPAGFAPPEPDPEPEPEPEPIAIEQDVPSAPEAAPVEPPPSPAQPAAPEPSAREDEERPGCMSFLSRFRL